MVPPLIDGTCGLCLKKRVLRAASPKSVFAFFWATPKEGRPQAKPAPSETTLNLKRKKGEKGQGRGRTQFAPTMGSGTEKQKTRAAPSLRKRARELEQRARANRTRHKKYAAPSWGQRISFIPHPRLPVPSSSQSAGRDFRPFVPLPFSAGHRRRRRCPSRRWFRRRRSVSKLSCCLRE